MATIGKLQGDVKRKLRGSLRTLSLSIRLEVEAIPGLRNDNEPSHRVYAITPDGELSEIGAAWTKETREDRRQFLSITLDDPSFAAPLNVAAFPGETGDAFNIVWNRPRQDRAA